METIFDRTYAAVRALQRETYGYAVRAPRATAPEDFEALAEQAREVARMLDRCALAVDGAADAA